MKKDTEVKQIQQICEKFVKAHYNDTGVFTTKKIRDAINLQLGYEMSYEVADFAVKKPENKNVSNYGEYFVSTGKKGCYVIKK